jgi:metal-sulfur cluster biosynthetic enzyme
MPTVEEVLEVLKKVHDPEMGMNIVDLGLVYHIVIQRTGRVDVDFTVTSPGCPVMEIIYDCIQSRVAELEGVTEVSPLLVWDPPWTPASMSEAARLELGYPI